VLGLADALAELRPQATVPTQGPSPTAASDSAALLQTGSVAFAACVRLAKALQLPSAARIQVRAACRLIPALGAPVLEEQVASARAALPAAAGVAAAQRAGRAAIEQVKTVVGVIAGAKDDGKEAAEVLGTRALKPVLLLPWLQAVADALELGL